MRNALIVFKKEFYRVISDKRLLFSTILLPGVMIFAMYSLMGNAIDGEQSDVRNHEMIVYTENIPGDIKTMMETDVLESGEEDKRNVVFTEVTNESFEEIEAMILNGEIDLYVSFDEDFEEKISSFATDNPIIPNLNTYYNPGEDYSSTTYNYFFSYLSVYKSSILNDRYSEGVSVFTMDVANDNQQIYNRDEAIGKGFASFLPMIIIMFLFSGAMSIGPDSIAGEKERGTIATLLVTPVKRSEIAIGKVLSLSVIALMSAVSSFIGILLSLPKLMQMGDGVDANIYGITEYAQILIILLATVLVIIGIVSVVSAFAKTIKEASMLILPFYFISIIIGITSMFSKDAAESAFMYLIPLYSSVNMLVSILTFNVVPLHFTLTVISSVVYVSILIYIMNRLFSNEKVMFSK
jgi:sodium transport system permease protein